MIEVVHLNAQQLEAGLDRIRQAPKDAGPLELIVRRPREDGRELLETGQLDTLEGLVGDNWKERDPALPDAQITVMNTRLIDLLAGTKERWPLAGDQLYADLDLSAANLPAGTRLALGAAVLEVTAEPHTGCSKFAERFGPAATKFVNSPAGKQLRLRGVHARVLQGGTIRVGDILRKMEGN